MWEERDKGEKGWGELGILCFKFISPVPTLMGLANAWGCPHAHTLARGGWCRSGVGGGKQRGS